MLLFIHGLQDLIAHLLQVRACQMMPCSLFDSSFSGGAGIHLVAFQPGWGQALLEAYLFIQGVFSGYEGIHGFLSSSKTQICS